jgi:hypothetical protein
MSLKKDHHPAKQDTDNILPKCHCQYKLFMPVKLARPSKSPFRSKVVPRSAVLQFVGPSVRKDLAEKHLSQLL